MLHGTSESRTLPVYPEPLWRQGLAIPSFPALQTSIDVDVVIVGGGITGITAAYELTREGLRVALLEASTLLNGTTAHTTAKISAQHGLIYDELIQHMGRDKARLYYEANAAALRYMANTASQLEIECDFREQDAYLYATTESKAKQIEREWVAYQTLGIEGNRVNSIPFAISVETALCMKNQAQFHPLLYLERLVGEIMARGGQIFEGTTAVDVQDGKRPTVVTREGQRVSARKVLACSHFPFYDAMGFYFARMYAERGYILAAKIAEPYPGGMYISADSPERSLRSVTIAGEELVLIGGENHVTGRGVDTLQHYEALERFGRSLFTVQNVLYRWSNQDLFTLDRVPYIGEISQFHPHVLVATGYRKWGMTTSTVAALLLCDYVLERDNPFRELYTPARFYIDPSLKNFFVQNANVGAHLVLGKLAVSERTTADLANDEGGVILHYGERAGAYKDPDGQVFIVDTTCTHLGCEVKWNHGDRTWDCPCHGSRFNYQGEVIEGPAQLPLARLSE